MAGEVAKEAGKMVADAALNAIFQGVSQIASPLIYKKLGLLFGVEEEVKKLSRTLLRIQAVLNDARDRHFSEHAVRLWAKELRDAALDAEDVVDEMETEYLRRMAESGIRFDDIGLQVRDLMSRVSRPFEILPKLTSVLEKLDEISKDGDALGLRKGVGWTRVGRLETVEKLESSSVVDESCIFGRRGEREKIVDWLLSSGSDGGNVPVLPIVGMGGIGKTTLAQLVYNDERVKAHFGLRSWVSVSQVFDVRRLTKGIIHSATRKTCDLDELEPLQVSLMEVLRWKRYLLVLDDVWCENSTYWECLRAPLLHGLKGSKILITTRSPIVSKIMGTVAAHELGGLSDSDSLSLFKKVVKESLDGHPNLLAIGEKIVNKCVNLPLALKTLGGLLQGKIEEQEWNVVLNSMIWDLPEDKNDIVAALRLSYHHLPAHLQQCFEYCSVFPKGYEFRRDELVQMWMAEGFLRPIGMKQMEEVGSQYFDELLLRSFFERHSSADELSYTMHNLIHDLVESVSAGEYFRMEDDRSHGNIGKARHASSIFLDLKGLCKTESLRTFLLLQPYSSRIEQVPDGLLQEMGCLRVLDLSHTRIIKLPESIEKLKHLRYLNLSSTLVEKLPQSTCKLYNLQTLRLESCRKLTELPHNMKNLTQLRHLILNGTTNLISMPPGIGRLTSLHTLSKFIIRKTSGCGIGELKGLMNLRGAIEILNLEKVRDVDANLNNKLHLHKLILEWKSRSHNTQDGVAEDVLQGLQPHANLKELYIKGYSGLQFPSWMLDGSLSNLVTLHLSDCRQCLLLPPVGKLPLLKHLDVDGMHRVRFVKREICGDDNVIGFPSLESLRFCNMCEWREWGGMNEGEIPRLHALTISKCPNLCALPSLPSLRVLEIEDSNEVILSRWLPSLASLSTLKIYNFRNLKSLPCQYLRFLTMLKELEIKNCEELDSWPNEIGFQDFTSLETLTIRGCSKLRSFPNEGLPSRLTYLGIFECGYLEFLPSGIHRLTSLRHLEISDCNQLLSFREEGLPTMLRYLNINRCRSLGSLVKWLQNFSSLETLIVNGCPQLKHLPEDGLPTSLGTLRISNCPDLEEWCLKEINGDWCTTAHNPCIVIGQQQIS